MGEWVLQRCFGVARDAIVYRILDVEMSVRDNRPGDGMNLQIWPPSR